MPEEHPLQSTLPKELASICTNDSLPPSDKVYGGDLEKALKSSFSFLLVSLPTFGLMSSLIRSFAAVILKCMNNTLKNRSRFVLVMSD